jgi:hypothetical protein
MSKNIVNIIDNFLPTEIFYPLSEVFLGPDIPWYFLKTVDYDDEDDCDNDKYQFSHSIWEPSVGVSTPFYDVVAPCIEKLNCYSVIRIKSNLNPQTNINKKIGDFHTDTLIPNATTAILYLNTNNGYTLFESGDKIESIENRVVVFNSQIKHTGVSCTDEKCRVLINFNYFSKDDIV